MSDGGNETERSGSVANDPETVDQSANSRSPSTTRPSVEANGPATSSSESSTASSSESSTASSSENPSASPSERSSSDHGASFGNGTHRVGTDIAPGTYRAPGGDACYWARLSGFSGEIDDVIANGGFNANPTVTIASSDAGFETRGCGTWTKAGSTSESSESQSSSGSQRSTNASFGDGTHRVGTDIAPGTYRAPGGDACYWARLSGFSGEIDDVIANGGFNANPTVTITSSDVGFETRGCGTWDTH